MPKGLRAFCHQHIHHFLLHKQLKKSSNSLNNSEICEDQVIISILEKNSGSLIAISKAIYSSFNEQLTDNKISEKFIDHLALNTVLDPIIEQCIAKCASLIINNPLPCFKALFNYFTPVNLDINQPITNSNSSQNSFIFSFFKKNGYGQKNVLEHPSLKARAVIKFVSTRYCAYVVEEIIEEIRESEEEATHNLISTIFDIVLFPVFSSFSSGNNLSILLANVDIFERIIYQLSILDPDETIHFITKIVFYPHHAEPFLFFQFQGRILRSLSFISLPLHHIESSFFLSTTTKIIQIVIDGLSKLSFSRPLEALSFMITNLYAQELLLPPSEQNESIIKACVDLMKNPKAIAIIPLQIIDLIFSPQGRQRQNLNNIIKSCETFLQNTPKCERLILYVFRQIMEGQHYVVPCLGWEAREGHRICSEDKYCLTKIVRILLKPHDYSNFQSELGNLLIQVAFNDLSVFFNGIVKNTTFIENNPMAIFSTIRCLLSKQHLSICTEEEKELLSTISEELISVTTFFISEITPTKGSFIFSCHIEPTKYLWGVLDASYPFPLPKVHIFHLKSDLDKWENALINLSTPSSHFFLPTEQDFNSLDRGISSLHQIFSEIDIDTTLTCASDYRTLHTPLVECIATAPLLPFSHTLASLISNFIFDNCPYTAAVAMKTLQALIEAYPKKLPEIIKILVDISDQAETPEQLFRLIHSSTLILAAYSFVIDPPTLLLDPELTALLVPLILVGLCSSHFVIRSKTFELISYLPLFDKFIRQRGFNLFNKSFERIAIMINSNVNFKKYLEINDDSFSQLPFHSLQELALTKYQIVYHIFLISTFSGIDPLKETVVYNAFNKYHSFMSNIIIKMLSNSIESYTVDKAILLLNFISILFANTPKNQSNPDQDQNISSIQNSCLKKNLDIQNDLKHISNLKSINLELKDDTKKILTFCTILVERIPLLTPIYLSLVISVPLFRIISFSGGYFPNIHSLFSASIMIFLLRYAWSSSHQTANDFFLNEYIFGIDVLLEIYSQNYLFPKKSSHQSSNSLPLLTTYSNERKLPSKPDSTEDLYKIKFSERAEERFTNKAKWKYCTINTYIFIGEICSSWTSSHCNPVSGPFLIKPRFNQSFDNSKWFPFIFSFYEQNILLQHPELQDSFTAYCKATIITDPYLEIIKPHIPHICELIKSSGIAILSKHYAQLLPLYIEKSIEHPECFDCISGLFIKFTSVNDMLSNLIQQTQFSITPFDKEFAETTSKYLGSLLSLCLVFLTGDIPDHFDTALNLLLNIILSSSYIYGPSVQRVSYEGKAAEVNPFTNIILFIQKYHEVGDMRYINIRKLSRLLSDAFRFCGEEFIQASLSAVHSANLHFYIPLLDPWLRHIRIRLNSPGILIGGDPSRTCFTAISFVKTFLDMMCEPPIQPGVLDLLDMMCTDEITRQTFALFLYRSSVGKRQQSLAFVLHLGQSDPNFLYNITPFFQFRYWFFNMFVLHDNDMSGPFSFLSSSNNSLNSSNTHSSNQSMDHDSLIDSFDSNPCNYDENIKFALELADYLVSTSSTAKTILLPSLLAFCITCHQKEHQCQQILAKYLGIPLNYIFKTNAKINLNRNEISFKKILGNGFDEFNHELILWATSCGDIKSATIGAEFAAKTIEKGEESILDLILRSLKIIVYALRESEQNQISEDQNGKNRSNFINNFTDYYRYISALLKLLVHVHLHLEHPELYSKPFWTVVKFLSCSSKELSTIFITALSCLRQYINNPNDLVITFAKAKRMETDNQFDGILDSVIKGPMNLNEEMFTQLYDTVMLCITKRIQKSRSKIISNQKEKNTDELEAISRITSVVESFSISLQHSYDRSEDKNVQEEKHSLSQDSVVGNSEKISKSYQKVLEPIKSSEEKIYNMKNEKVKSWSTSEMYQKLTAVLRPDETQDEFEYIKLIVGRLKRPDLEVCLFLVPYILINSKFQRDGLEAIAAALPEFHGLQLSIIRFRGAQLSEVESSKGSTNSLSRGSSSNDNIKASEITVNLAEPIQQGLHAIINTISDVMLNDVIKLYKALIGANFLKDNTFIYRFASAVLTEKPGFAKSDMSFFAQCALKEMNTESLVPAINFMSLAQQAQCLNVPQENNNRVFSILDSLSDFDLMLKPINSTENSFAHSNNHSISEKICSTNFTFSNAPPLCPIDSVFAEYPLISQIRAKCCEMRVSPFNEFLEFLFRSQLVKVERENSVEKSLPITSENSKFLYTMINELQQKQTQKKSFETDKNNENEKFVIAGNENEIQNSLTISIDNFCPEWSDVEQFGNETFPSFNVF